MLVRSPESPEAAPHYSLQIPDDWTLTEATEFDVVGLAPEVSGRFRSNCSVSRARIGADADIESIADRSRLELSQSLAKLEFHGDDTYGVIDGSRAVAREYAFAVTNISTAMYQAQLQVVLPISAEVSNLVTLTGTCSGSDRAGIEAIRRIVQSFRVVTAA